MTLSNHLGNAFHRPFTCSALALLVACSTPAPDEGSGDPTSGGSSSMAGGLSTGGKAGGSSGTGQGGMNASGGAGTGGSSAGALGTSGGKAGQGAGGSAAGTGGSAAGIGGSTAGIGGSAAGIGGSAAGIGGGAAGIGGSAAGAAGSGATGGDGAGGSAGMGGSGAFDPCPATDPCKVLPLGDSITWGISYGGGYRIKLFAKAAADMKKMTFVGYDKGNPPSSTVVNALGDAKALWAPDHEGHSGWTIQQDDELVLGTSTQTNDGVSYAGKKVVLDFGPHIVLIHLGTNDFRGDIAGAPGRLGKVIDHVVTDAPNALVVVASVIPYPGGGGAVATFNAEVPKQVKTRADAGKHVIYVDMFAGLTSSDLSDGVHPNEGGYEKMAVVWYAGIKQYLH